MYCVEFDVILKLEMAILANWILSALAILIVANYLPDVKVANFQTALIVALALGIVNAVIKPVIVILTLPINIITFGLFTFVINALLILLVANIVPGFTVVGFVPALIAAIALWIISTIINFVVFPLKSI